MKKKKKKSTDQPITIKYQNLAIVSLRESITHIKFNIENSIVLDNDFPNQLFNFSMH